MLLFFISFLYIDIALPIMAIVIIVALFLSQSWESNNKWGVIEKSPMLQKKTVQKVVHRNVS